MTYLASQILEETEIRIVAQSDESVSSSTTLQDDDELFFSADANTTYEITILCITTCASATPDLNVAFTTLTDADWLMTGHRADQDDGGLSSSTWTPFGNDTTTPQAFLHSGTADQHWLKINCSYITAGTSGTVYFRWAQNVSDATAVIRKVGSHMIVRKIGDNS